MTTTFFAKQTDFRNGLEKKHKIETVLLVGFNKVGSGKQRMIGTQPIFCVEAKRKY
jgi:hypothetical protein